MTEKHQFAHEELIRKYTEERNELIRESNKDNDSKYNELKAQFDRLVSLKEASDGSFQRQIEELKDSNSKDIETIEELSEAKYNEMKNELESLNSDMRKTIEEQNEKSIQLADKITKQKEKIEVLEEEVQAAKIDLEANAIELELIQDEKKELLAEMTESSKVEQEDLLNTLTQDEVKQQNRKLR